MTKLESKVRNAVSGLGQTRGTDLVCHASVPGFRIPVTADRRSCGYPVDRRSGGFTLIEILVVMAIFAVIAGVGVGMLTRQDRGLETEATARLLRSSLRLARNTALRSGVGSTVRIDGEAGIIEVCPVEVAGNWHFEDDTASRRLRIQPAGAFEDGGIIGRCMAVNGSSADLGAYPFYSCPNGFRFSVFVRPKEVQSAVIAELGQAFRITVDDGGAVEASIGLGKQKSTVAIRTRKNLLVAGEWKEIRLTYDRIGAILSIGGVAYARKAANLPVNYQAGARLKVGGRGFVGHLDEARFDVVGEGRESEMGSRVQLGAQSDRLIRFDGRGRLDPRAHTRSVAIALKSAEDDENPVTVRIDRSGAIR